MEPTTVLCLFLRLRIPVVGWPPIRSFPKNTLSSTSAKNNGQTEEKSGVACLYVKKVDSENDKGFQQFLDNVRYKANGILRYERVFGPGYVSTGGVEDEGKIYIEIKISMLNRRLLLLEDMSCHFRIKLLKEIKESLEQLEKQIQ